MRIGKASAFKNFFFTISRTMLNFIHYKKFFRISYSLQVATTQKLQPFQVNGWVAFSGLASVLRCKSILSPISFLEFFFYVTYISYRLSVSADMAKIISKIGYKNGIYHWVSTDKGTTFFEIFSFFKPLQPHQSHSPK